MGRIDRSWDTFVTSVRVGRQDKHLLWLPILSMAATVAAVVAVIASDSAAIPVDYWVLEVVQWVTAFFALAFIQTYFYAAMVAAAHVRLSGGAPHLRPAFRAANQQLGKIFWWSAVLATVNMFLVLLSSLRRMGFLSDVAAMGWNMATYFVVPVLMFEDLDLDASMKRSRALFKQTWGESMAGELGIGVIALLLFVPVALLALAPVLFFALLGPKGAYVGLGIAALVIVAYIAFMMLVQAVYKTELYRFAASGRLDDAFQGRDLAHLHHATAEGPTV